MLASVDLFPNPREWDLGLPWHLGNSRVKKTFRGGCLCSWSLFHRRVWITWHGSLKEGKIDLTHSFKGFNLSWQGQAWRSSFMSSRVGGPGRRESKRKCSGLPGYSLRDPLPLTRSSHLPKSPEPPKRVPPSGGRVFKIGACGKQFTSKS